MCVCMCVCVCVCVGGGGGGGGGGGLESQCDGNHDNWCCNSSRPHDIAHLLSVSLPSLICPHHLLVHQTGIAGK